MESKKKQKTRSPTAPPPPLPIPGVLAVDHLGQPVALFLGECLRVGLERRLHNRHVPPVPPLVRRLARHLLGRAHERDLGVGEAGGGDGRVVEDVRPARHVFDGGNPLRRRRVREHVLAVGVPDAVQVGDDFARGVEDLHFFVHRDKPAAVGLDADGRQPQAARVGRAPGGDEDGVHFQGVDDLLGLGGGGGGGHGLVFRVERKKE